MNLLRRRRVRVAAARTRRDFVTERLEPRTMLAYVPRVVGYFPEYRWSTFANIDLDAVGHLNYFSISADASGALSLVNINTTHMTTLVNAAHAKNVTVSIVVG